jgi:hypothetical protein
MRLIRDLFFILAALALVVAVPLAVLAADDMVGGVAAQNSPWWHGLLVDLVLAFGALILGMIAKLLTRLFDYLAEKTGWAFVSRVDDLMMEVANDIYQAEIQPLKKAREDGKVTREELASFKRTAIERAKTYLGAKGIAKLGSLVNGAGVDAVLGAKLEKAVKSAKVLGLKGPRLDPTQPSG